jgi:uncharacterized membrane protein
MAFCAKCGAQLAEGTSFCVSCGAPVGASAGGPVTPVAAGTAMSSNVAGLLTYILGFITGIIFLVIEPYKNDKFVRFHAFQSIFYDVALFVLFIAYTIVAMVLSVASLGTLEGPMHLLAMLVFLATLAYRLFLMYKAYNSELYKIPFIGDLAAKQAG